MSLALRNDIVDVFRAMDEFFDRPLARKNADPVSLTSSMDEGTYYIRAVAPGFSQENIDVSVNNRVLKISGKIEEQLEDDNMFSSSQRAFQQIYQLPHDAIPDKISADMKNGILVVNIPRWNSGSDDSARQIPIGKSPPALEE